MYNPTNRLCDVCGRVCDNVGYRLADGGWCCRDCFNKTKVLNPESLERMDKDTIVALKLRSEEKSPYELNISQKHEEEKEKADEEFFPVRLFLGIVVFIAIIITMAGVLVETGDYTVSTYAQVRKIIRKNVDEELGDDITRALYESGAFIDGFDMEKNDVSYLGDGEYDLYVGITARVIIDGDHFKIYTYYKEYTNDTRIFLYDSTRSKPVKILREDEHEAIRKTQRNIYVDSLLNLNWYNGVKEEGSTKDDSYFVIKFTNLGDKTIEYMSIKAWEKYDTGGRPKISYKTNRGKINGRIEPDESESYVVTGHGWSFESSIVLAEIVIYYEDGAVVEFDEYDCNMLL